MAAMGLSSTTAARSPSPIRPSSFLLARSRFSAIASSSPARSFANSSNTLHRVQNCSVFFRSPSANGSVRYKSCFLPLPPRETNVSSSNNRKGRMASQSAYQGYNLQVIADTRPSIGRMVPPSVSETKTSHHNQKVSDHILWRVETERLKKLREQECGYNTRASFGRSTAEIEFEEFNSPMTKRAPLNLNGDMQSTPEFSMAADGSSYIQRAAIEEVLPKPPNGQHTVSARKLNGQQLMHSQKTILETVRKSEEKGISSPPKERINGNETVVGSQKDVSSTEDLARDRLRKMYGKVLIVDNISMAKDIVSKLTNEYRHMIHACDTEVSNIDVKQETPVDHGEIICFSIYSGPDREVAGQEAGKEADFGGGKSCIWVDVLNGGGKDMLLEFAKFFEDPKIKKVWHNYSFDCHVIRNYGIEVSGFHADTMHMARLWNSSRRLEGGYSLEALTGDSKVMSGANLESEKDLIGKVSMKTIFGKRKLKKDGSEGKIVTIAPVEELQRDERVLWICYSALDAMSTFKLYDSLRFKLSEIPWRFNDKPLSEKYMLDFYHEYWRDFGEILVKMETEGMLVDRSYLAEIEKQAKTEQAIAASRFRNWASKYCDDAKYMNVGSDTQLRQLLFGGILNSKNSSEALPESKTFKVPNVEGIIQEGKKTASKFRNITLHSIPVKLETELYTASGWPSVSGAALKTLAGKVSADYDIIDDSCEPDLEDIDDNDSLIQVDEIASKAESTAANTEEDTSAYGTVYTAFLPDKEAGKEACHAIAALCEMCSIDSLISNFILPLQGSNISGKDERIHCSLNINTETGRLSARRPNLQNQPALEKDRYKIRQAFIAAPGKSLIVADYGQLELRVLAHLANCTSMLKAFKAGGDFHSRTALNMYQYIKDAVDNGEVILEWHPQPGQEKPPVPLLKDAFGSERRKAKMLNFSIAYGKTPMGLAKDWKVPVEEAKETVNLWYKERQEVLKWQKSRIQEAHRDNKVHTLLGRARTFPSLNGRASRAHIRHIERAAINAPVQGSAADIAMCAMLEICKNRRLKELGWKLLLQVHDEVILEGPTESSDEAKAIVVNCMANPFNGTNFLKVELAVDAKCAGSWYAAK